MQTKVKILGTDGFGRNHIAADANTVEDIYKHNLIFWTTRNRANLSEEENQFIVDRQSNSASPFNRGAILKLQEIYAATSSRGEFSMLEIGAANGTAIERIKDRFPNPKLKFVGFECLPILAKDFKEKFPSQKMYIGDVEDFIGKEKSFFTDAPFTLFYASVVFIMIKPDFVRKALRKAAELTNQFLIYDYMEPPREFVQLAPAETLVLHMPNRPVFWFVHPWKDYLAEVGFNVIEQEVATLTGAEAQSSMYDRQVQGMGYIHAVRI